MMRLLIIFLTLTFGLAYTTFGQVFSGQVFVMTEHLSADRCEPQIECDCCSSDIFFLTDKTFVMMDKCIHNDSYYRGTYTLTNENLTLNFDQFVIKEIYSDETEETKIEKQNLKIKPIRFHVSTCKEDHLTLQRTDLKVLTKAFKESNEKSAKMISELKKTDPWKKLQ
jgi:hypothetical protein